MYPTFSSGDKAEFNVNAGWAPVVIQSHALQWVNPHESKGHIYLAQHEDLTRGQQPFLVHSDHLRPREQWEPCPGKHRTRNMLNPHLHMDMERRVED